jgi:pantoate--beta-alanine ligase
MVRARELIGPNGHLVTTVFVNPTQFGAGEDFDRYPRTLEADVALCERVGVDVVFAPSVAEVYGSSNAGRSASRITVDPGPLGDVLEGASRPGHFRGVLTVVATLLHLTEPDVACFGEKDYQQLTLIRAMAEDLRFRVRIVGVETVRESDGLAMSSRNRYLSPTERQVAEVVPRALRAAVLAAPAGPQVARETALEILRGEPGAVVDYVEVTDPMLGPPEPGPGRILAAVQVGSTRLIDNMACRFDGPNGMDAT